MTLMMSYSESQHIFPVDLGGFTARLLRLTHLSDVFLGSFSKRTFFGFIHVTSGFFKDIAANKCVCLVLDLSPSAAPQSSVL